MKNTGNGWQVNREEAIAWVGEANVDAVERKNCEWSSGGGKSQGEHDTMQRWTAYHKCTGDGVDKDGVAISDLSITAVYFVDDSEFVDSDGDPVALDNINWEISHYIID
jgi:hypothetical protein